MHTTTLISMSSYFSWVFCVPRNYINMFFLVYGSICSLTCTNAFIHLVSATKSLVHNTMILSIEHWLCGYYLCIQILRNLCSLSSCPLEFCPLIVYSLGSFHHPQNRLNICYRSHTLSNCCLYSTCKHCLQMSLIEVF